MFLLGNSVPKKEKGIANVNMRTDDMRKPVHQAPTHLGSSGVNPHLKKTTTIIVYVSTNKSIRRQDKFEKNTFIKVVN